MSPFVFGKTPFVIIAKPSLPPPQSLLTRRRCCCCLFFCHMFCCCCWVCWFVCLFLIFPPLCLAQVMPGGDTSSGPFISSTPKGVERLREVEPIPSLLMLCPSQNTEVEQHNTCHILEHFNAALRCEKIISSTNLYPRDCSLKSQHTARRMRELSDMLCPISYPGLFVFFVSVFLHRKAYNHQQIVT